MGDIADAARYCMNNREDIKSRISAAREFLEIKKEMEGWERAIRREGSRVNLQMFVGEDQLVNCYVDILNLVRIVDVTSRFGKL